jgi:hypothetical protein
MVCNIITVHHMLNQEIHIYILSANEIAID